ncbi:NAD(P)-binding protein [Periconia macrospinosa]|uniref:NAD(P)-binding protein n=1 Tax=Periconia macrospinosa TaxID=97972 RepID=A0A2V1E3W6_9PLEO|nr:NAD(P)-binding protein [Periconia macrospinosa]
MAEVPGTTTTNGKEVGDDGKEKVIILSGASRGIGLSTAHYLLSHSHKLVLISRSHAALDQLHYQYGSDRVEVLAGDLSDDSLKLPERAVDLAVSRWGRVDALVVNHGTLEPVGKIADVEVDEWRKGFGVNVFGAVGLIRAAIPSLRTTKGRIILVSSGAAISAYQGWGPYGASKAVLNHVATTLAVEEPLITTLSIRPGVVDTEMQREIREVHVDKMSAKDGEKFLGLKVSGGLLKPELPGGVIARLCVEDGAVEGGKGVEGLSGRFLSWNDGLLEAFQGEGSS